MKPTVEANETKQPQSTTKWEVFEKAGFRPVQIVCDAYKPFHFSDQSCHSKVLPKFENIMNHLNADHGGGFKIKLEQSDGKPWQGWRDLKNAQIEAFDLRCDVCSQELPLNAAILQKHLFKAHSGDSKRSLMNSTLRITLSKDKPLKDEETDFLE